MQSYKSRWCGGAHTQLNSTKFSRFIDIINTKHFDNFDDYQLKIFCSSDGQSHHNSLKEIAQHALGTKPYASELARDE
jgi:hypothetical protein